MCSLVLGPFAMRLFHMAVSCVHSCEDTVINQYSKECKDTVLNHDDSESIDRYSSLDTAFNKLSVEINRCWLWYQAYFGTHRGADGVAGPLDLSSLLKRVTIGLR